MIKYLVYSEELTNMKIGDGFFEGWRNPSGKKLTEKFYQIVTNLLWQLTMIKKR